MEDTLHFSDGYTIRMSLIAEKGLVAEIKSIINWDKTLKKRIDLILTSYKEV